MRGDQFPPLMPTAALSGVWSSHDAHTPAISEGWHSGFSCPPDMIASCEHILGQLPAGDLHPDLVNRLASESARTAQAVFLMSTHVY
jgi:hypothetical protein